MAILGQVRFWTEAEGWGVLDSEETPGGCWVHFSCVKVHGYQALDAGTQVEMLVEEFPQDGYDYRATAVWPAGQEPVESGTTISGPSTAFTSGLHLVTDQDGEPG
ncbi:hypothetical protein [Nocardioides ferulae]|uniref:hypothetical protein n=1 Tax=Nocardioides ferulae TaxID=2340821 RepID=UPI001981AEB4|nr:hypothetical protein [Nocardioides ferulae]